MSEEEFRVHLKAKSNWGLAYTLINNPDVRLYRKGYLNVLNQAKKLGLRVQKSDKQVKILFF